MDEEMSKRTLIVNISGGLTSSMMSALLKSKCKDDNLVFIFANTGCENDETLDFVDACDREFKLNVVWLEAVVNPQIGVGITHRITSYHTAYRSHQYKELDHPFHALIRKEGIPNPTYPRCSDRLKALTIEHYKKVNNLCGQDQAIGIRMDESHRVMSTKIRANLTAMGITPDTWRLLPSDFERMKEVNTSECSTINDKDLITIRNYSKRADKYKLVYPLIDWFSKDKEDVNIFWEDMPFTLKLEDHEGNCQTCWKKSNPKLNLISVESPHRFKAFKWFEKKYKNHRPNNNDVPRAFFRGHTSAKGVLKRSKGMDPQALRKVIGARYKDESSGCSESCDGFSLED